MRQVAIGCDLFANGIGAATGMWEANDSGPVSRVGINGQMNVTAAPGMLVYFAGCSLSRLTWLDGAGRPLGVLGEPREHNMFRRDGRHAAAVCARRSGRSRIVSMGKFRHHVRECAFSKVTTKSSTEAATP